MKVRDILVDVEKMKESQRTAKDEIMIRLKNVADIIEKFDSGKKLTKEDMERMNPLKDYIQSVIKDDEQKKIIRGEG